MQRYRLKVKNFEDSFDSPKKDEHGQSSLPYKFRDYHSVISGSTFKASSYKWQLKRMFIWWNVVVFRRVYSRLLVRERADPEKTHRRDRGHECNVHWPARPRSACPCKRDSLRRVSLFLSFFHYLFPYPFLHLLSFVRHAPTHRSIPTFLFFLPRQSGSAFYPDCVHD